MKKIFIIVVGGLALSFIGWKLLSQKTPSTSPQQLADASVEELVATEQWIAMMGQAFKKEIAQNPEYLLDHAPVSLSSDPRPKIALGEHLHETFMEFSADSDADHLISDLALGGGLRKATRAGIAIIRGEFENAEHQRFRAELRHSWKGLADSGKHIALETRITGIWELQKGQPTPQLGNNYRIIPEEWSLISWKPHSARMITAPGPLFEEASAQLIPDPDQLALAQNSDHQRHLKQFLKTGTAELPKDLGQYFTTDATAQHPGLAVVDINNDGHDDFYLCVRWGTNLLFENQKDGTFKEVGQSYGLNLDGQTTSAIFADFDNDGDQDAFLGRSLKRSIYLENQAGYFVARDEQIPQIGRPFLTTSVAAADYDGDGLLDLYLSTYGFATRNPREEIAKAFLKDYPEAQVERRFVSPPKLQRFVNLSGPPNVLLRNTGSGFEISPFNAQVDVWRETLQGTWGDYDGDGDPDLYVCNDFAPDQLFRNDGSQGFTDVTATIGHERMMGFGMGATFGDFDNDLDLDLYVSNMYSKAGLRITAQAKTTDRRFRWFAEGNLLFGNDGDGFAFLSGKDSPMAPVAIADWSWGGQFLDIENDSDLDLYVPNGYFTAPQEFSHEEDL